MLHHVIAIVVLSLLCGSWVLFQRWIAEKNPEGRSIEKSGSCCGQCGAGACSVPSKEL